eukprot:3315474-Pyramimonas_sp.AAC.1
MLNIFWTVAKGDLVPNGSSGPDTVSNTFGMGIPRDQTVAAFSIIVSDTFSRPSLSLANLPFSWKILHSP